MRLVVLDSLLRLVPTTLPHHHHQRQVLIDVAPLACRETRNSATNVQAAMIATRRERTTESAVKVATHGGLFQAKGLVRGFFSGRSSRQYQKYNSKRKGKGFREVLLVGHHLQKWTGSGKVRWVASSLSPWQLIIDTKMANDIMLAGSDHEGWFFMRGGF